MNLKFKRMFILLLSVLLILSLAACSSEGEKDEKEPVVMEAYYNLDGHLYRNDGNSSRPAEADGTYTIRLACKGELVTKTVKADKDLIGKIDALDVLGFNTDKDGVITGVLSVKDMGGKIVAEGCYVESVDDGKVTVNPQADFSGKSETLKISEKKTTITSMVYIVSTLSELSVNDQITAIKDGSGTITDVYVLASPSAEPPVMDAYWNIDGAEHLVNGVSTRVPMSDGTYKVRTVNKSQVVTLKVNGDQELINKIDSLQIFGVVLDDAGVVVGVKTVEEMGGQIVYKGYSLEAGGAFEMNVVSETGQTVNIKTPSRSCYVVDLVSDPDMPERIFPMDLIRGDKIVAVQNYSGEITNIYFYEAGFIRAGTDQFCPHCCEEGQTVHFTAWTEDVRPGWEGGHYFLYADKELADQFAAYKRTEIVIDLNGYKIFNINPNKRIISTLVTNAGQGDGCYIGFMDSSEAKTGTILNDHNPQEQNGNGAAVWVTSYGTVEMFGGTIDASNCYTNDSGVAVYIGSGCTFIMHEGATILGGTSEAMLRGDGSSAGGKGGAVYNGGTFIMYGGQIIGGSALGHDTRSGLGGAVYNYGIFEMHDGEISGGYADNPIYGAAANNIYDARTNGFMQFGGTIG